MARFTGCKYSISNRKKVMFNAFIYLKPVERFNSGSDMSGFRSLNDSTSKKVLNLLELVKC